MVRPHVHASSGAAVSPSTAGPAWPRRFLLTGLLLLGLCTALVAIADVALAGPGERGGPGAVSSQEPPGGASSADGPAGDDAPHATEPALSTIEPAPVATPPAPRLQTSAPAVSVVPSTDPEPAAGSTGAPAGPAPSAPTQHISAGSGPDATAAQGRVSVQQVDVPASPLAPARPANLPPSPPAPAVPAPASPAAPSATSGSGGAVHGHHYGEHHLDAALAVLDAGFAASVAGSSARAGSGFVPAVVGGADNPGAAPD